MMTDKEKLIELLDGIQSHGWRRIETDHSITLAVVENKAIAEHLLANGVTIQRWIPVTERLPDVGSRVIACGEKGGVFLVRAEGKTTGFGKIDGASKYRSFTHWMPLPEPPKEG